MKMKSIKLTDGWQDTLESPQRYRVEQVQNSVEFKTGQMLEKPEVEGLCNSNGWNVTIVPYKP